MKGYFKAVLLHLKIVWRLYDGERISWQTAWNISKGIHLT